jgi:DNA-binding HxlR family transcriptional regulator
MATEEIEGMQPAVSVLPVRVEYDLSPSGTELFAALTPLAGWALEHKGVRPL